VTPCSGESERIVRLERNAGDPMVDILHRVAVGGDHERAMLLTDRFRDR
jgi:hypothetical protein